MTYKESIVAFGPQGQFTGIFTETAGTIPPKLLMVLANSGIVHRVGANRISVDIARSAVGVHTSCLRFDISGLGETPARLIDTPWEISSVEDIGAAIGHLSATQPSIPIALFGNCGGAAKSFWTALAHPEVRALILTNPPPLNGYTLKARSAPPGLEELIAQFRKILERGTSVRIVFVEGDVGQAFFDDHLQSPLSGFVDSGKLSVVLISESNHTFAPACARKNLLATVTGWLSDLSITTVSSASTS